MKDLRSRVLYNLFLHPLVASAFVVGFVLLVLSFEGPRVFRFYGFGLLAIAVVTLMLRATVLFQNVVSCSFAQIYEEKNRTQRKQLDDLDIKLSNDDEPRNEKALRELRDVYETLAQTVQSGIVREYDFLNTAQKLFTHCVANLRESYLKRRNANHLPSESKIVLIQQSEELLKEVEVGVSSLAKALVEIQGLNGPRRGELSEIQKELEDRIQFAKKVEEKVQNLDWLKGTVQ